MEKFKALYQGMYDDLTDAEMMIDYACEIKKESEEDLALASEIAKYAQYRLSHFWEFHKLFQNEMSKEPAAAQKSASDYLWGRTEDYLSEWHDRIKNKIEKF